MRRQLLRRTQHLSLAIAILALAASGWLITRRVLEHRQEQASLATGRRVGLVAGHSGYDSGAVCPDGLTEAEVNLDIARRTAARLRRMGAQVDLLQEFDPRLSGYRADVFVSIHADTCEGNYSGFKVARVEHSALPEAEDRLVDCLWQQYEVATSLARHPNTITFDMREYHAFGEIDPQTPAAIIEVGFLSGDRWLLTAQPDRVAKGVADGILCFLAAAGTGEP
ncbi:MAG: N-acetylmuramoyl-L-alanine amidase [Anaerolineae bacterium]|nr:N-acetylmuramoyl-L-alanine amidase [Anaerolineae bacterium]